MVRRRAAVRIAIVGALLVTVPGAGLASGTWAYGITGDSTAGHRPLAVVSLGDSYIAGSAGRWRGNSPDSTGDRRGTDRAYVAQPSGPTYDPTLIYGTSGACFRSDVAEITHVRFPGLTSVNLACAGATTGSIIRAGTGTSQNDRLAEVARSHRVLAIALSIGGNDVGFGPIVQACVIAFLTAAAEPCNPAQQAKVEAGLPAMRAAVGRVIDDIRATMTEAGYRSGSYRLIVQSYPTPLPGAADLRYPQSGADRTAIGGCPFYDADVEWGHTRLTAQLAETLRAVTAERHAQFLELRDALRGHELCSTAARQPDTAPEAATSEWIRFIDLFGQGDLVAESLHPNAYGQAALGHCLRLTLLTWADVSCHGVPGRPPSSTFIRPLRRMTVS